MAAGAGVRNNENFFLAASPRPRICLFYYICFGSFCERMRVCPKTDDRIELTKSDTFGTSSDEFECVCSIGIKCTIRSGEFLNARPISPPSCEVSLFG